MRYSATSSISRSRACCSSSAISATFSVFFEVARSRATSPTSAASSMRGLAASGHVLDHADVCLEELVSLEHDSASVRVHVEACQGDVLDLRPLREPQPLSTLLRAPSGRTRHSSLAKVRAAGERQEVPGAASRHTTCTQPGRTRFRSPSTLPIHTPASRRLLRAARRSRSGLRRRATSAGSPRMSGSVTLSRGCGSTSSAASRRHADQQPAVEADVAPAKPSGAR